MKDSPIIIVGFGLAGVTLSWQLFFKKIPFLVYANPQNTCTKAAAGIINPIVFKRLNMSWLATDLMPYADGFYHKIEQNLNDSIRRHFPIVKIFNSLEDENNWMAKQKNELYGHYLGAASPTRISEVDIPYGTGSVNTIGHLDTIKYLEKSKLFFEQMGIEIVEETFDYEKLHLSDRLYNSILYKQVIFCEGYGIKANPYFNYLPLNGTHGDTFIIRSHSYKFQSILNKNMFVMPLGNNLYKVGATYNWEKKEPEPTSKGKAELIKKLNSFAHFSYEIVSQQAGIRPTVTDRRPLIGTHSEYSSLSVFNGLGTKGVMLAPYFSNQLIESLLDNKPLNDEVNITRFEKFLP